jgi:hypothetical protein
MKRVGFPERPTKKSGICFQPSPPDVGSIRSFATSNQG